MNKPVKPNITIPESFAKNGIKIDFDSDLITEGFDSLKPDVLAGDNLNKFIDDTYKGLNYGMAAADAINLINEGETLTVVDGKLTSGATGGGLEVCDIGMALYVDETKGLRRYLNGQIVDINTNTQLFLNRLKQITTLHPSLLCTEQEWQTAKTMSAFGQVGKFVFNYSGDEIVSVRLPRVVNVQGLFDLQNLGMTVGQALPSHTHTRGTMNITGGFTSRGIENVNMNGWGAFNAQDSTDGLSYGHDKGKGGGFNFDASRSWTGSTSAPNYSGTVATGAVQQEAIQYPYFIQIATGSETENNIINEIELNNPYSLFDSKYSDHELNNLSWLKSSGQWNAKDVYPDAYNELLTEYNNSASVEQTEGSITFKRTPKGYKIALADQETAIDTKYATDGIAWYYILDTTNVQFKLPRTKFGFKGLRDNVGNDIAESLPNITGSTSFDGSSGVIVESTAITSGSIYKGTTRSKALATYSEKGSDIAFDASRSSSTYQDGAPVQERATQMYLYFYVGETVQNANLIDAGRIGEILPTKTDMQQASGASMPSNRYIDLTLGASGTEYTAPANGWYYFRRTSDGSATCLSLQNSTRDYMTETTASLGNPSVILPVIKGDIVAVFWVNGASANVLRFIYAEGEV